MAAGLLACLSAVAAFYALPPQTLSAIRTVEGGHTGSIEHNRNGTDDLGVMQVNSLWLPAIAHDTALPRSRVRRALIDNDCFNLAVAAAILKLYLREARGDTLKAVGFYHSHTPPLRRAYQLRILSVLAR